MKSRTRGHRRDQSGSLAGPLVAIVVLIAVGIGSIGVDMSHVQAVQTELQNATDAAALAGAQSLYNDPSNVEFQSREIGASNTADGRAVSNSSPGTTVNVQITPPGPVASGLVEVTAQMEIRHLLAPVYGRRTDVLTARSVAGRGGTLLQLNGGQGFPMAVCPDCPGPNNGPTLRSLSPGQRVEFTINSQQHKNAAWTSFTAQPANSQWVRTAMETGLDAAPPPDDFFIPPVQVGDQIYLLNGISGFMDLGRGSQLASALVNSALLVIPVVNDMPPMNQQGPVTGFISFDPTDVTVTNGAPGQGQVLTIGGILIKGLALGSGNCSSCPENAADPALENLSVGPVVLLK